MSKRRKQPKQGPFIHEYIVKAECVWRDSKGQAEVKVNALDPVEGIEDARKILMKRGELYKFDVQSVIDCGKAKTGGDIACSTIGLL